MTWRSCSPPLQHPTLWEAHSSPPRTAQVFQECLKKLPQERRKYFFQLSNDFVTAAVINAETKDSPQNFNSFVLWDVTIADIPQLSRKLAHSCHQLISIPITEGKYTFTFWECKSQVSSQFNSTAILWRTLFADTHKQTYSQSLPWYDLNSIQETAIDRRQYHMSISFTVYQLTKSN